MLENHLNQTATRLLADTAGVTGDPFFAAMAKSMARHLGTRWAIVGEFIGDKIVRVIAGCDGNMPTGPFEYPLPGSPCEQVYLTEVCSHPSGVADAFPEDCMLREMGAESYFGVCVHSADGRPLGLISVLHDQPKLHTEGHVQILRLFAMRVGAEFERQRVDRQLLRAQKLEGLGVLAGGIAHDFNNLLVGILGNVELALTAELPPTARAALEDASRSSRAAADLTSQLLAYSGRHEAQREPIAIEPHVRDTVRMLTHVSPDGHAVQMEIQDNLPPVHGDASQLRQIVMNLITNAFEAMGDRSGSPTLSVETVPAHSNAYTNCLFQAESFREDREHVALHVEDSGIGMSADTVRLAFDPFFTSKESGRGLGLSAVIGILRNHEGAISVDSRLGVGTKITVFLPPAPEPESRPQAASTSSQPGGKHILIVDDNDIVRMTLVRTLERLGYVTSAYADGASALREVAAPASGAPFDCMIVDKVMPGMSGPDLIDHLREEGNETPIILTTGFNDDGSVLGEKISCVLSKPWTAADLQAALGLALELEQNA